MLFTPEPKLLLMQQLHCLEYIQMTLLQAPLKTSDVAATQENSTDNSATVTKMGFWLHLISKLQKPKLLCITVVSSLSCLSLFGSLTSIHPLLCLSLFPHISPISVALSCLPLVFLFSHSLVFLSLVLFQPHPHISSPHPSLPSAGFLYENVFVWERQWVRGRWSETMWVCVFVCFICFMGVSCLLWDESEWGNKMETLVRFFFPPKAFSDCRFYSTSA